MPRVSPRSQCCGPETEIFRPCALSLPASSSYHFNSAEGRDYSSLCLRKAVSTQFGCGSMARDTPTST
ncbi:hypothetical protein ACKKBG_A16485 [Auxenochlorella protothecoides x Auxenochlorella symbiontica]